MRGADGEPAEPTHADLVDADRSPGDDGLAAPVDEVPVDEVPVDEVPVDEVPVNEVPVNEVPVDKVMSAGAVDEADAGAADTAEPDLPSVVRKRVLAIASDVLGALPADEIPSVLRPVAKFAPARRAQLAATQLAAALADDVIFRQRAAKRAADAAKAGEPAATDSSGDPIRRAVLAYLGRPDDWRAALAEAVSEIERANANRSGRPRTDPAERTRDHVAIARAEARAEVERMQREVDDLKADLQKLRKRLGEARERAREAERTAEQAVARADAADERVASLTRLIEDSDAENRRLQQRLTDTEATLAAVRRSARDGRSLETVRARLLVDTLVDAAQGLRRELALPPLSVRPADLVKATAPPAAGPNEVPGRGRDVDDPALLRAVLELPQVHLVVDGYNVTKAGYGEIPLQDQRARLLTGLGGLAAQTGAEVTVVFDGAALSGPVPVVAPRGVRVRFSPPGVTADEVIRDLVAAEPPGRPVAVVSADREVADGVRRTGARPVDSRALLRLLNGR
jgi:predicted RNA-binding protein with PIN domain